MSYKVGIPKRRRQMGRYCTCDYGPGYAVVDRVFPDSRIGVELRREASGNLNAAQCRVLAEFLTEAAEWLQKQESTDGRAQG